MKSILKNIQKEPCRSRELTQNELQSFSNYSHLQRYFPALDQFNMSDSVYSSKNMELSSKYYIDKWLSSDPDSPRFWKGTRTHSSNDSKSEPEPCDIFVKVVHLLNPIDLIKEKYTCPEHPLIPQSEKTWKNTLFKIHSHNNQAYVDAVANFVLSRFRELDLTPHCVLYYGSHTGISKLYQFNISGEYETYRQCRWFWDGMKSHSAQLTLIPNDPSFKEDPHYQELYKEVTTCPFNDEDLELELDSLLHTNSTDQSDNTSVHSFTFDDIEENTDNSNNILEISNKIMNNTTYLSNTSESKSDTDELSDSDSGSGSESDSESGSDSDSGSDETVELDDIDICLEIPNMPIIMIHQEAQEGVMDELLDEDELDGFERGSQGWEARWLAWIFQIISTLTFLQSTICFTHNDLHSNNVVWRETDKKYVYYKSKDDVVWRVPTFGKIFSIIDFGRSIFRVGKHLWVSDDHWPDQDAGEQYNFGPFFDHNKPKIVPNPSFDLCRLSVSLMDGLFDEPPPKKKGKGVSIMSEENSWKVYETQSPLYNLLWSWTVDDAGRTVYEDKDGNEKYEGFDLYIHIAHHIHQAIPKDQLHRPIFKPYLWKNKIPSNEKIYPLNI